MKENAQYLSQLSQELDDYKEKLSSIKQRFKGRTEKDIKNISASLHHLFEEAKDSYTRLKSASQDEWEPLKQLSAEAFSRLKYSLAQTVGDYSDKAWALASHVAETSKEYEQRLEEYVREHPMKSVLVAAGIGFVLGKLLK